MIDIDIIFCNHILKLNFVYISIYAKYLKSWKTKGILTMINVVTHDF